MSNVQADHMIDKIETAKRWLRCAEECKEDAPYNPFDCENIANCLYRKVEQTLLIIRELR